MEDSAIAAALSTQLAERIGAQRFELWFGKQAKLHIASTHLTICAASKFVCDWLRKHFAHDIHQCWEALAGQAATLDFAVDESLSALSPKQVEISHQTSANDAAQKIAVSKTGNLAKPAGTTAKRQDITFADFVVGPSNEYAFRAAELTASGRQQACPLLFCGSTGVGKTHLLRAIQREHRRRHPHSTTVYLTAEQFTTGFVEAIRGSGLPSFRQKCRGAELLIIDDLQFFIGKARTLEELQHTIDTRLAEGRQLVLAGDRPLADLRSLGPELASRVAGGLTCEIEPPEFTTRRRIARKLADEIGIEIDDETINTVATQVTAGARELRGALHRLHAMSLAGGVAVTRQMAEQALADLARYNARCVRLEDVQKVVCEAFGVEPAQLRSERKGRSLTEPRMLAMWLARKYTRSAWSEIGHYFGRRSHSTVISAHRRVEKLIGSKARIGMSDRDCGVEEALRKLESALRTA